MSLSHPDYVALPNGTLKRKEQVQTDYTQPYWGNGRSTIEEQIYNVGEHEVNGITKAQSVLRHAVGKTLLEIACSPGVVLKQAREEGFHAIGIEPCHEHVQFIQDYSGCEVICGLFGELDLSGRTFDTIIAMDVLEHVPDPEKFAADALALLNPGGRFIFMVPAIMDGVEFRDCDFHPEHLHLFHVDHITAWLKPVLVEVWHPGHTVFVIQKSQIT